MENKVEIKRIDDEFSTHWMICVNDENVTSACTFRKAMNVAKKFAHVKSIILNPLDV